jgi:hypothetical protein
MWECENEKAGNADANSVVRSSQDFQGKPFPHFQIPFRISKSGLRHFLFDPIALHLLLYLKPTACRF